MVRTLFRNVVNVISIGYPYAAGVLLAHGLWKNAFVWIVLGLMTSWFFSRSEGVE